jgi:hypothetical protein
MEKSSFVQALVDRFLNNLPAREIAIEEVAGADPATLQRAYDEQFESVLKTAPRGTRRVMERLAYLVFDFAIRFMFLIQLQQQRHLDEARSGRPHHLRAFWSEAFQVSDAQVRQILTRPDLDMVTATAIDESLAFSHDLPDEECDRLIAFGRAGFVFGLMAARDECGGLPKRSTRRDHSHTSVN